MSAISIGGKSGGDGAASPAPRPTGSSLAAAPTFATMALMTAVLGGGDGAALLGDATWVAHERNGPDVSHDGRLPCRRPG